MYHRTQHSFPSRRSSDLIRIIIIRHRACLAPDQAVQLWPDEVLGAFAVLVADLALLREDCFASGGIARQRDRKSKRLNSSHQINSYAVFCLKKKRSLYSS